MWQDPTDVAKRKPRRLRGTPANKFSIAACSAFVGAYCLFFYWLSNSESEWVLKHKKRIVDKLKPKESEAIRREMFSDFHFASVVTRLNQKQLDKEYAKYESGESTKQ